MLLAGDEFGRTQRGNNNAYCQDNEISWLDWSLAAQPDKARVDRFCRPADRVAAGASVLRCAEFPARQRGTGPGMLDIAWFDEQGREISPEAWNDPAAADADPAPRAREMETER